MGVVMSYLLFVFLLISRVKGFSVKQDSVVRENVDGASDEICGDPECNLVCGEDQECRPTGDQCVMPPCCVAWICEDKDELRLAERKNVHQNGQRWVKAAPYL